MVTGRCIEERLKERHALHFRQRGHDSLGEAVPALPPKSRATVNLNLSLCFPASFGAGPIAPQQVKVIAWTAGGNDRKMKGNNYLQQFALPNFFFFVTTAYNILRHRGVPVGKRDFLGPVDWL
jgi:Domain of unknown function (DUF1993)